MNDGGSTNPPHARRHFEKVHVFMTRLGRTVERTESSFSLLSLYKDPHHAKFNAR